MILARQALAEIRERALEHLETAPLELLECRLAAHQPK
jgi:hypothetical protein